MSDVVDSAVTRSKRNGRPVVIDPELLVHAFLFPHGDSAKLLALCAYGRLCAAGMPAKDVPPPQARDRARGRPLRDLRSDAEHRRQRMEEALPIGAPKDLLLATSPWHTRQLALYAQSLRELAPHLSPDVLVRQVNVHAGRIHGTGGGAHEEREHIHDRCVVVGRVASNARQRVDAADPRQRAALVGELLDPGCVPRGELAAARDEERTRAPPRVPAAR